MKLLREAKKTTGTTTTKSDKFIRSNAKDIDQAKIAFQQLNDEMDVIKNKQAVLKKEFGKGVTKK